MEPTLIHVQATTKTLAYLWVGQEKVEVGEWVLVPPNWYKKEPQVLQVVAVGGETDYKGQLATIQTKVDKTPPAEHDDEMPF